MSDPTIYRAKNLCDWCNKTIIPGQHLLRFHLAPPGMGWAFFDLSDGSLSAHRRYNPGATYTTQYCDTNCEKAYRNETERIQADDIHIRSKLGDPIHGPEYEEQELKELAILLEEKYRAGELPRPETVTAHTFKLP